MQKDYIKNNMNGEVAKIRNRGDITIPIKARNKLKLNVGDYITVKVNDDQIIIKKLVI